MDDIYPDRLRKIWEIVREKTEHLWGETAPDHLAREVFEETVKAIMAECGKDHS